MRLPTLKRGESAFFLLLAGCAAAPVATDPWRMPPMPGPARASQHGTPAPRRASPTPRGGDLPDEALYDAPEGWTIDAERAFGEARRLGRPVFVDFTAAWCVPCRLLDEDTLAHPDVRTRLADEFVALRVDVTEETSAGREFAERFRARKLPTMLVLTSDGSELLRIESFVDAAGLLARLDRTHSPR